MTLNPKITVNRRHQRANVVSAAIIKIASKYINSDLDQLNFHRELFTLIFDSGMEIITDDMRKEAGLEPRNENGCTPLELMLIEYFFISRMLKPIIVSPLTLVNSELIKDNDK